ncbi:hypothetical protein N7505_007226 [Penicillium chrysogenum]|uniref:D-arabinitol 2-dehydrogenase n=1 Tax=Penicillium chrysogenum TaxID=5076 RepID=A0ABQ8WE14_PENCH|nr:hypothetical protein N7505_007226 [Penicillium chrysogenum]
MLANQNLSRARLLGKHRWPKAYLCRTVTNDLKPLQQFDVRNKVITITGGARDLGLEMATQLSEAGAHVYCLDRLDCPQPEVPFSQIRHSSLGGSLHYRKVDVVDAQSVNKVISSIAEHHERLDGLVAAAGITRAEAALKHSPEDLETVINVNFSGAFNSAAATARQMLKFKTSGSILLVASIIIQLGKNLAQEWGPVHADGSGGIRVNNLCPGHVYTPMANRTMQDKPGAKEVWEQENMLGRIAKPQEFRGVALFLMSNASSFMTGSTVVVDGGHTAW